MRSAKMPRRSDTRERVSSASILILRGFSAETGAVTAASPEWDRASGRGPEDLAVWPLCTLGTATKSRGKCGRDPAKRERVALETPEPH